ncbi:hypothetical protein M2T17_27140, partial [Escherichia coli]|nr:hypothetical protein [Escherichia coli]
AEPQSSSHGFEDILKEITSEYFVPVKNNHQWHAMQPINIFHKDLHNILGIIGMRHCNRHIWSTYPPLLGLHLCLETLAALQ